MRLVPETVQPERGRPPNTAYIVQIVYEGLPQQLLTDVRDILAMRAPLMQEIRDFERTMKALPPPDESPDDAADTQEEFYPDLAEAGPPTWVPAPTRVIERPGATRLADLIDLARRAGVDLATFSARVRTYMQWPSNVTITKKFLRETLTMQDVAEISAIFEEVVERQQVEADDQSLEASGATTAREDEITVDADAAVMHPTDGDDVPSFSGPEPTQVPSGSPPMPEATPVLADEQDAAQSDRGPQNHLSEDVSHTTTARDGETAGMSPRREGLAPMSDLKRVQDYAEAHGLGKDLSLTLSRYPDGITVLGLADVETALHQRVASEEATVKGS